jgi:hypothetical protein
VHSFEQKARAILETAQYGGSGDVTLICTPEGGLHVVMGEGSFVSPAELPFHSATYRVVRKGNNVFVTGSESRKRCALQAPVISPVSQFLLNDQPLYRLDPPSLSA